MKRQSQPRGRCGGQCDECKELAGGREAAKAGDGGFTESRDSPEIAAIKRARIAAYARRAERHLPLFVPPLHGAD